MNSPQNYGPTTERSVKAFQKHYKLRETGVADPKTLSLIGSLLEDVLKRGDNSSAVQQLKENLNLLGFEVSMNSPKSYGPATEKAVKAFQAYYGLHANGTANDVTLKKLEILIENAYWAGQKSKQIEQLKENLNKLGFSVGMSYPESFGPATERAVKAFQEFYGLKVSGVAEESTLNKIQEILNSPLKRGANSAQVRKLKEDLNKLGFSVGMKNPNNFGPATESAVKAFQKAYNLPQSGIADEVTLNEIDKELKKVNNKLIKIFIDAGHGGSDPGAVSGGLKEKDLTLYIAKKIQQYLGDYKNVVIKLSRTGDKYLTLKERTKMANDWGADFFFSVHINAGGGTGIESHIHNENYTKEEIKFQNIIHSHIANGLKSDSVRDRGKKKANFHVVRETKMSAMLFEYLFIDNKTDQAKLKSNSFLNKLGKLTEEA